MHLTSADKRAARDGFKFVVLRGGERVCYTTTAAEAKRECGKHGRVVSLSRGHYAARNPAASIQDPKYAAVRDAIGLANHHSKEWGKLIMLGNKEYGADPYKFVSGGGQEHWPRQLMNEINRELRAYQDAQHEAFAAFKKIHPRMNHRSKLWHEFTETAIPAGGYGFGKRRNPSSGAKQRARDSRHYGQTYSHRLGEWREDYSGPTTDESLRAFRKQLAAMKKAGHKVDTRKEFAAELAARRKYPSLPNPRRHKYR